MEGKKNLIWISMVAALVIFGSAAATHVFRARAPVSMETTGFPTIGKADAPVEVVLIEDFQCPNCRIFSQKIIPKIQSHYIRSGKVRFTLVPVAFLAGSQFIANAALEVHQQNPGQFFAFLKDVLHHEGELKLADLIRFARRLGGIDLAKLQTCIEKGCHNQELEKNLSWARGMMGGQFKTPALYVNGSPGSTYSFEAIQYQIDQILGKP